MPSLGAATGCAIGRPKQRWSSLSYKELPRRNPARKPRLKNARKPQRKPREKAQAHQDKILAAMRADLAAGVDRNVVIKRAIGAGVESVTVAEFFGLSRWRVHKIAEPEKILPQWTDKQVELLLSMWSGHHTAQEIADALGTSRGAVLGKIWRIGLHARKSKNSASLPEHCRPRALSGSGSRVAT
jgi:hypothetical protein